MGVELTTATEHETKASISGTTEQEVGQTELFVEGLCVDCPKQNIGIRQVGKISKECRVDVEAQPGAAEAERRGRRWQRPREIRTSQAERRNAPRSARGTSQLRRTHLQHLHQRQMQLRTTASNPRELEGKTLEGENST